MHIVYQHYKDRSRELEDVKDGWWTCPPELILSPKEDKQLTFLWRMWNRNNVLFVMHDKAVIAKSPGNFVSENIRIIKFDGIYGLEVVN